MRKDNHVKPDNNALGFFGTDSSDDKKILMGAMSLHPESKKTKH